MQRYVDRRTRARGIRGQLSPATIKKEIVSLRTAWNWAVRLGLAAGRFPYDGLRYPKLDEKPTFQTRAEIDRKIAMGGLSKAEVAALWDALYVTQPEIEEVLCFAKDHAGHGWIYPALAFAHTGARRSEIIRLRTHDLDLQSGVVTIHERKRTQGKRTTRRVSLSPFLAEVLRDWLERHPGGPYLFCHAGVVERSKKRSRTTGHQSSKRRPTSLQGRKAAVKEREDRAVGPLTRDEAHDHLKRTLRGSKWEKLRGWHVFRHSFISLLASKGVDQRIIDEFVGHQSEEQRRRYRHLYPDVKQEAIRAAFS